MTAGASLIISLARGPKGVQHFALMTLRIKGYSFIRRGGLNPAGYVGMEGAFGRFRHLFEEVLRG